MSCSDKESSHTWIIGYGNSQCRDDGIGPYVVSLLEEILGGKRGITLRTFHQLEPELVEELYDAQRIILIDATVYELQGGSQWTKVEPECEVLPHITHHCKPSFLLGLLVLLYDARPDAWVVSVQGDDFGYCEGLTSKAQERAKKAVREIVDFVTKENN
jgi:hydrogenase maturation protease